MLLTHRVPLRPRLLTGFLVILTSVVALSGAAVGQSHSTSDRTIDEPTFDSGLKLVFKNIDSFGAKCAMIYGGPSLGEKDFLIEDCGGPQWKQKWSFDVGFVRQMSSISDGLGWWVVGRGLFKVERLDTSLQGTFSRYEADENIESVFFDNAQFGWSCGNNGLILKTGDGGVTWQRQVAPTDHTLREIRFMNSLEGWIRGGDLGDKQFDSVLLTTNDGGEHWTEETGPARNLWPVFFTSPRHGCGIENHQVIRCTKDGETWPIVFAEKKDRRNKSTVFFLNEKEGWVAGEGVWSTADGGQTWQQQLSLADNSQPIERIIFVDSKLGWAQNLTAVWRTQDGGKTWSKVSDEWLNKLTSERSDVAANGFHLRGKRQ